jgi:hypothetical protein
MSALAAAAAGGAVAAAAARYRPRTLDARAPPAGAVRPLADLALGALAAAFARAPSTAGLSVDVLAALSARAGLPPSERQKHFYPLNAVARLAGGYTPDTPAERLAAAAAEAAAAAAATLAAAAPPPILGDFSLPPDDDGALAGGLAALAGAAVLGAGFCGAAAAPSVPALVAAFGVIGGGVALPSVAAVVHAELLAAEPELPCRDASYIGL